MKAYDPDLMTITVLDIFGYIESRAGPWDKVEEARGMIISCKAASNEAGSMGLKSSCRCFIGMKKISGQWQHAPPPAPHLLRLCAACTFQC